MVNHTQDWWELPASTITRGDARSLFARLQREGLSHETVRKLKLGINTIYNWAIDGRIVQDVTTSPTIGVNIEKSKEDRMPEILTREQIKTLLYEAHARNHPWFPVWVLASYTGLRSGELLGLRVESCSLIPVEKAREQDKLPPDRRGYGNIALQRSWCISERKWSCTKAKYWRIVPVSKELYWFLQELFLKDFGSDEFGKLLLPPFSEWKNSGNQALVLREFCKEIGVPSVKFHTLRACFATHLLEMGVSGVKVMKICGWKGLKTMERYLRLAGVEVAGVTEGLGSIPNAADGSVNVVNLRNFQTEAL
jgi:integrase